MGCYGIGITRLPAAAIEQNHDERGIIWPDAIAPFTVVLCPITPDRFPEVKAGRAALCRAAGAGVDVMLDDRGERPGAMFADWELIGVPHRVTIGDRASRKARWNTSTAVMPPPPKWPRPTSWPMSRAWVWRRAHGLTPGPFASTTDLPSLPLAVRACGWRLSPQQAHAGGQLEEPLIDSVRTALSSAIANQAPPVPEFKDTDRGPPGLPALAGHHERPPEKAQTRVAGAQGVPADRLVRKQTRRAGCLAGAGPDPGGKRLSQIRGLQRRRAGLHAGHAVLDARDRRWRPGKLFHMQTNLRFGCVILRHYLDREKGDLFMTLGRYNGSRGKAPYPNAVFSAQRNWRFEGRAAD
jgi:hypothetical protein